MRAPGASLPSFSAASIMLSPMRSLMEPAGFWLSSLANNRQGPVSSPASSIIGVLPIVSRTLEGTLILRSSGVLDRGLPAPARDCNALDGGRPSELCAFAERVTIAG